jgi:hypothetical protein
MLMKCTNSSASFQTGYDLWEYLLVARPDEGVNEKIRTEKKDFHALSDYEIPVTTQPQIAIAGFLIKEAMEGTMVRWIQNICNLHAGFTVMLNNFSGIPPHTIYLRVQDARPFEQLANALKILDGFVRSNDCPPLHVVNKPHLAIAEGLPESVYEKAIKEYSKRSFHACFKTEKLFLLKRDAFMNCHLVNSFVLSASLNVDE